MKTTGGISTPRWTTTGGHHGGTVVVVVWSLILTLTTKSSTFSVAENIQTVDEGSGQYFLPLRVAYSHRCKKNVFLTFFNVFYFVNVFYF